MFGFVVRWTWRAMGVLGVVVCVGALLGRSWVEWGEIPDHKQETWYPSPDGKYVALYKMEAGGFPISSFCNESISVYPAESAHLSEHQEQDYQVYRSSCKSVAIEGVAHLQWKNRDTFRISMLVQGIAPVKPGDLVVGVEFKIGG
jgi:hypothetical protein